MSEIKHTSGPWNYEHVSYFADLPGLGAGTFEISNPLFENWIAQAQTEANARLIAAAPDLLEVVKMFLDRSHNIGASAQDRAFRAEREDKALAAIAKAEGRT